MDIQVSLPGQVREGSIAITGSKSETNRLLLLRALYPGFAITNASSSDDSDVMQAALASQSDSIDVHHAGTAMRFLTAYFSICEGRQITLTGSQRMKERPISVLVDALRMLGADIAYLENEGYPPLRIKGKKLTGGSIAINANVSSQYITALLLIAAKLENGLQLELKGEITSRPYIEMTLSLLKEIGIITSFINNVISVHPTPGNLHPATIEVESDWSSASYFYSIVALSPIGTSLRLSSFSKHSLQGDSALQHIYNELGVQTSFDGNTIVLRRTNFKLKTLNLKLIQTPDIAQTIAVTCFGLGIGCHLTGLHTLKIKETDRLTALKAELEKLGAKAEITQDSLTLQPHSLFRRGGEGLNVIPISQQERHIEAVETYNDHRMAMAFAPLAVKRPLIIKDAEVVSKSYPAFWEDMEQIGLRIEEV